MKGKLKYLFFALIIVVALSALGYYLAISKFYDIAEKLILDAGITSDAEISFQESKPKEEIQTPDKDVDDIKHQLPPEPQESSEPQILLPSEQQKGVEPKKSVPEKLSQAVTFSDKRKIMNLVAKKLTADDISYLMSLLKDGLTQEEKKQAVKLAKERFSSEEIKEIRNLYYKYREFTY